MSKRFVVGYINWSDYDLKLSVVEADNFREAIMKHPSFTEPKYKEDYERWFQNMPEDLEDIKEFFFDADSMIDVIEI